MIYLAHPVAAESTDEINANLRRAGRWLKWLAAKEPDRTFTAPWLALLLLDGGAADNDPERRAKALRDAEKIVARCDGIVLAGGQVSSGMAQERDAMLAVGGWVCDLTGLGSEPPDLHATFFTNLLTRVIDSPVVWGQRQWAARAHWR